MADVAKRSVIVGIVTARYSSQRFPGKVLGDLQGRPMLAHTLDRARFTVSTMSWSRPQLTGLTMSSPSSRTRRASPAGAAPWRMFWVAFLPPHWRTRLTRWFGSAATVRCSIPAWSPRYCCQWPASSRFQGLVDRRLVWSNLT